MEDKLLDELITTLAPDIRAEAMLAVLLEKGTIDLDHIVVQTKGVFKRPFSKDVLGVELRGKKSGNKETLYIDISREGLYDMLPEGLFHQTVTKTFKTTQDSVEEFRQHRREEKEARNFFLPLEQEFYRLRMLLELEERKALFAFTDPSHQGLFTRFWGKQPVLNQQQSAIFFFLLPLFYHIVGNLPLTALCFEAILGQPVSLKWVDPLPQTAGDYLVPLGKLNLGVNFVLGNTWSDEFPALVVSVGPLRKKALLDYLPGGKAHTVLALLYSYFLPVEVEPLTKVLAKKADEPIMLTDTMYAGRLGYTSAI
jgi:hypothetical protein